MNFKDYAQQAEPYIIEQRRWFHQHPELSWEEKNTTDAIAKQLEAMGLEVKRFEGHTGCTAMIKGGKAKPGCKTVALRADIDALPVDEKTGLPFASENAGVMHACGHDCHISMLLGAAKLLSEHKDELEGNVKIFFQAAEETCFGAEYYVNEGVLDGVDAIFGQHIWGAFEEGKVSVQAGPRMASCDNFTIEVEGVSAHGTAPHAGIDAIVAAASIIMNVQTFASRSNDPLNPFVMTIGEITGGQRFNIIANKVVMKGTTRTFNPKFRLSVEGKLRQIVENTAAAFGAKATVTYDAYPSALYNDDEELNIVAHDAAVKLYGEDVLKELPMMMGSEDFAYYADKIPAVFGFLGSGSEQYKATNHNDHYTVNESVLKQGSALAAQFAFDFLAK